MASPKAFGGSDRQSNLPSQEGRDIACYVSTNIYRFCGKGLLRRRLPAITKNKVRSKIEYVVGKIW